MRARAAEERIIKEKAQKERMEELEREQRQKQRQREEELWKQVIPQREYQRKQNEKGVASWKRFRAPPSSVLEDFRILPCTSLAPIIMEPEYDGAQAKADFDARAFNKQKELQSDAELLREAKEKYRKKQEREKARVQRVLREKEEAKQQDV